MVARQSTQGWSVTRRDTARAPAKDVLARLADGGIGRRYDLPITRADLSPSIIR